MAKIPYYDTPVDLLAVTVYLHHQSNVFMMDEQNYKYYQSGKIFGYHDGFFDKSPVKITVQCAGRWYLVVDNGSGDPYPYRWS